MSYDSTLKAKHTITHDVNHYIFSRPDGLDFKPGQAVEIAIRKDGWKDEGRPFTFTSLPGDEDLEFVDQDISRSRRRHGTDGQA